jgi:hypothetical protein
MDVKDQRLRTTPFSPGQESLHISYLDDVSLCSFHRLSNHSETTRLILFKLHTEDLCPVVILHFPYRVRCLGFRAPNDHLILMNLHQEMRGIGVIGILQDLDFPFLLSCIDRDYDLFPLVICWDD